MYELSLTLLVVVHLAATLFMTGLIWMVQLVHYPLFASVGGDSFVDYQRQHTRRITWIVAPAMLVELVAAVALLWCYWQADSWWGWATALGLLVVIWLSTAVVQIPCHAKLAGGFVESVHRRLVKSNWLRTIAWTIRAVIVLLLVASQLLAGSVLPMAGLDVGDRVPDFSAQTSTGEEFRFSDVVGEKMLVLFFYPKSNTAVCTAEACQFRDSYQQFVDAGAEVIGVSSDSQDTHLGFATKHSLPYTLLSDADGSVRKLFGVPRALGLFPGRTTYVVDSQGIVKMKFTAQMASKAHVDEALAAVGNLTKSQ